MSDAIKCIIKGRVQGVFFRASTQEQAQQLNITGHAKNLPDGSVEVVACGRDDALQTLRKWLQHGPAYAKVESVECEDIAIDVLPGTFTTG